jgi:succinate dehydrogenase/fumarate reductase flavoprotein subunit
MNIPQKWDYDVDVAVLGFGGAGAVTAVLAKEKGARVLVLEKESFGGGDANTLAGAPFVLTVVDKARALEYLRWCTGGRTDDEVLLANMEILKEVPDYIRKINIPCRKEPFQVVPYGEYVGAPGHGGLGQIIMFDKVGGGPDFFNYQAKAAQAAGIEVLYNTPATRLIQDPASGAIVGVYAKQQGKEIAVKARKATVIATGGFAFNKEMVKQYITPVPVVFVGAKAMTGDGISMAQEVGAQLWHMNGLVGPMYWGIEVGDGLVYATYEYLLPFTGYAKKGSYIWVNKYGKRFDKECTKAFGLNDIHRMRARDSWFAFDPQGTAEMRNIPAFQIFDEKVRTAGSLVRTLNPATPDWSPGAEEELKKGWLIKANTIEELARKCQFKAIDGVTRAGSLPPDELKATIERWNANCPTGTDPDFGRDTAFSPIDTPPYYAMGPMFPAFTSTFGGPKHDGKQRVLDAFNQPIPRLYCIGDCGSINAYMYAFWGGPHMLTSGIIAANNAVKESSWDSTSRAPAAAGKASGKQAGISAEKRGQPVKAAAQEVRSAEKSREKKAAVAGARKIEAVCTLCPVTCVMQVTFDEKNNVIALEGAQCESGKKFVEDNKAMLLEHAK